MTEIQVGGARDGGSVVGPSALSVLRLLASGTAPDAFEARLKEMARESSPPWSAADLHRARGYAERIYGLIEGQNQREARLSNLVGVGIELLGCHDIDEASTTLIKRARIMFDADFAFISVRDDSGPDVRHHVRYVDGPTTAINRGLYFPIGDDIGLVSLYRPGQGPVWTADYPSDTRFVRATDGDAAMRSEGVHSLMIMPMEHEGQHFGNLYVGSRTVRSYAGAERSLFASLCSFASIALARADEFASNTTRIGELERRIELRTALLDTGAGPGGMDSFVHTAGEQLGVAMRVTGHDGAEIASYKWEPEPANVLSTALTVGDDYHGELSVASLDDGPVSVYPLHIQDLATTAAVVMCGDNRMSLSVSQLRNDLLHDVLDYRQRDSRLVQIYARRLALDLNQPHVVVIVRPERGGLDRASLWSASFASRVGGLRATQDEVVVLLVPGTDPGRTAQAVWDETTAHLRMPVTVSSAGPSDRIESIEDTYQDATRCLDAMSALGALGTAAAANELGFLGVLLSRHQDVEGFVRSMVGPVIDYDDDRDTDLLQTLDVYFTVGASPTRAAKILHTHPNTVVRRLDRVNELLGDGWQDAERLLDTQLAIKLWKVRGSLLTRQTG
ncbi:GAF domain-containing protein [Mycobacterium sp. CBMA271]|nr:GAF domain-containing protein [Mycobacteroides sp. CBMA 271]